MMTYKPEIGDAVRHWNCWESRCEYLGLDGVVIGIYDNTGERLVRFEDGTETRIYTDDLKLISHSEPSPEPSIDVLKRSKTMGYEPKLGDIVNWTTLDIDGVVIRIYDNNECRVGFEDGEDTRISTDDLKFISHLEPSSEPSTDDPKRSKTMNYEPKLGDIVNWTTLDIDGVVREIYDNKECRVYFEDGSEMRISTDDMKFISKSEPSSEPSIDVLKRSKTMTYKPEIGDAVNWTNWGIDCVVREIYDNKECRVYFEDGEEMRIPISYLTFISRHKPSPGHPNFANPRRMEEVSDAVHTYAQAVGDDTADVDTIIYHMLVDLMHLCERDEINWPNVADDARKVFMQELHHRPSGISS